MPTAAVKNGLTFLRRFWRFDINASDNDLEKAIEKNDRRENICARALIFGLLIEVVFAFWFRDNQSFIKTWAPVFADVLVAGGVLGEVHFASKIGSAGNELRRRSTERLADSVRLAGEANERASQADLKRVQLEEKLAPRSFLVSDVDRLKEALIQFGGARANVMPCAGFPEVARATWLLTSVLRECNWRIEPMHSPDPMWSFDGICVGTEEGAQEPDKLAAKALIEGLNSVDWATTYWTLALPVPFTPGLLLDPRFFAPIRIMIGYKPDPLFPKAPMQTGAP